MNEEAPRVAWIECPSCHGVFAIFRHPDNLPVVGQLVTSATFIGLDGEPIKKHALARCLSCGTVKHATAWPFMTHLFRRGERLPLVDTPVMEDFYAALKRQKAKQR